MKAGALLMSTLILGCGMPSVVRAVDGREIEGRFISEYAYMLYGVAADAEARGDLATALNTFQAAAEEDEESPEIWTRIGAIRCKLGPKSGSYAEAFERARSLDPELEPLLVEEARCALSRGKVGEALSRATRAVAQDPNDEEAALLHASLLERSGRGEEARREVRALTVRRPTSTAAWTAQRDLSVRLGDQAAAAQASERLSQLSKARAGAGPGEHATRAGALEALDLALSMGDLDRARKLGRAARVSPAEVAVRAAALGRFAAALEQAELVLGADPSEASARIAMAVAADLSGDQARFSSALTDLPLKSADLTSPSPLARLLFAELLDRRAGRSAAKAWLGPLPRREEEPPSGDPLRTRIEARVRARFGT